MQRSGNHLVDISLLQSARRVGYDLTDYRSINENRSDFAENKPRTVLFVGSNSKYFVDGISVFNYECIILESILDVNNWLSQMTAEETICIPKAIICEVNLSDGDVYSVFEILKNSTITSSIPIIAVGEEESAHKVKSLKTGINDFYHFPLSFFDLHKRIVFFEQFKKQKLKMVEIDESLYMSKIPLSKRLFDILFSSLALISVSPLLIIIAILIRIGSKGPVLYTAKRVGTGYKIFDFYKFRSMRVGADAELTKLKHLNQYGDGNKFVKISNDPRITKIGHFIRKTSIDEIPQLFNVLIGDMSIVGNRPLPLYEAEQLTIDKWSKRFLAPAGITGLWQVTKRGKMNMSDKERLQLDVMYAKKYTIWLDMKIILKTLPAMLQKEKV